jgi:hypothetical protein
VELYKESQGGAPDGPVRKCSAATDKRAGLRGEYEKFLIPQTPSDVISTYLLAPQQGVSGEDENASQYYVLATQLRSPGK